MLLYTFYCMTGLLIAGIGRNTRVEKQTRVEAHTKFEQRKRGLCGQHVYYVGVPTTRTVEFDQNVTTFELNPEQIKEYFQDMVNTAVDTSIKHVRAYVHAYLSDNIDGARTKIAEYGEVYSSAMQSILNIKGQSKHWLRPIQSPLLGNLSRQTAHECYQYITHV